MEPKDLLYGNLTLLTVKWNKSPSILEVWFVNTHAWPSQSQEKNSCLLVLALESSAASRSKVACLSILRMCALSVSELSKQLLMIKSQLVVVMDRLYFSTSINKAVRLFLRPKFMVVFMDLVQVLMEFKWLQPLTKVLFIEFEWVTSPKCCFVKTTPKQLSIASLWRMFLINSWLAPKMVLFVCGTQMTTLCKLAATLEPTNLVYSPIVQSLLMKSLFQVGLMVESELTVLITVSFFGRLIMLIRMELLLFVSPRTASSSVQVVWRVKFVSGKSVPVNSSLTWRSTLAVSPRFNSLTMMFICLPQLGIDLFCAGTWKMRNVYQYRLSAWVALTASVLHQLTTINSLVLARNARLPTGISERPMLKLCLKAVHIWVNQMSFTQLLFLAIINTLPLVVAWVFCAFTISQVVNSLLSAVLTLALSVNFVSLLMISNLSVLVEMALCQSGTYSCLCDKSKFN